MCHTAVFFLPRAYTLMALNWSPSAYASMASTMPQLPGVSAPMSRWCAVVTEKPISVPSWNAGTQNATSGPWEAPP